MSVPGTTSLAPGVSVLPIGPPGPHHHGNGPVALDLHGCGIVAGRFVTTTADLQDLLDAWPTWSPDALGSSLRGVLTAYVWSPQEETLHVLPDPWGGLVHRYRSADIEILSSDVGAVVSAMRLLGLQPRRSLEFATEVAAMGSGGLTPSSYEDIEVLGVLQRAHVRPDGVSIIDYSVASQVLTPFASYEEGLATVRAEIESNVAAVAASRVGGSRTVLAHLTGGIDTRMVLGATLAQGLTDQFAYLSLGPRSMPDRAIAERLAVEFGLTMTEFQGSDVLQVPSTLAEQARWPMEFSRGLLTAGPHGHRTPSDTVVLSGGFGGYMKGNYSKILEPEDASLSRESSARLTERLWGPKAFSADPQRGLYTVDVVDRRRGRFHALRSAAHDRGLGPAEALDWLFISVRNRYFLTEATRTWNAYVHRFDPLYTLSGARLALSLPRDTRATGTILLDLLRGWDERLPALPFDYPRVTPAYEALRSPIAPRAWSQPDASPRYDRRPGPATPAPALTVDPATPDVVARARELQAPLWQVRDLPHVREDLRQVLADVDSSQLGEVFNQRQLDGMLRWELKHRGLIRQVHHLYAALLWYAQD
ncbi:hypothetical protein [uncultured Serinicoccus sp.]|uniref:hypothetical protein n=1 Tax=uncultured Serinicoccus sp. TaxID=735514 RepID=UPI0026248B0E|nr:hypothetical protein [uncultured Serinicoccus sp.]